MTRGNGGVSGADSEHIVTDNSSAGNEEFASRLEALLANFQLGRSRSLGARCRRFSIAGQAVGLIRHADWELMRQHAPADVFVETADAVSLNPEWTTCEERTARMAVVLQKLRELNVFPTLRGWRDETYDVAARFGDPPLMRMERAATCLFGTKRYGVHLNGYVVAAVDGRQRRHDCSLTDRASSLESAAAPTSVRPGVSAERLDEANGDDGRGNPLLCHANERVTSVWFQRRSATKETWPSKIDIMVSGGLSSGDSVDDCLIREAFEEASMPEELVRRLARPAGCVSFLYEDERGIFPETIFCFDARLPHDFEPRASDSEVESFRQVAAADVAALAVDSSQFKLTSAPVALDFLVRHSLIDVGTLPHHYVALLDAIHQPLHSTYPDSVVAPGSLANGHCI